MAKKLKLKLDGFKNQVKTGIVTIEYLNGKVDYPLKLKNDREFKRIINLSDYKYKTKLSEDKMVMTTLQKLSNIKAEYRDIILNSEGYSTKDVSYVKIYNENELLLAKNDREVMFEGVNVVAHFDLEYIVDEKNNLTFLDLINNTFEDIIKDKYKGELIKQGDYYKVTEVLFEANLLSYEVITELILNIRALKTGGSVEEERYRIEALNLGMNTTEDVEKWVEVRKNKKKLEDLTNKGVIEEEEEIPSEVEEAIEID
ncbi:MAG: hypothetical protein KA384_07970 [Leptotrichiaceae bacterium]|nr:hypothetical protein [Leptotrichiaceae bacterium]